MLEYNDSKGLARFAEHLRTVHFSLIIVSVALFIAAITDHEPTLTKALEDVARITGLRTYLADGHWLQDYSNELMKGRPVRPAFPQYVRVDLHDDRYPRDLQSVFYLALAKQSHWTIKSRRQTSDFAAESTDDIVPSPETLGDFKSLWNDLLTRRICAVASISDQVTAIVKTSSGTVVLVRRFESPHVLDTGWTPNEVLGLKLSVIPDGERSMFTGPTHAYGLGTLPIGPPGMIPLTPNLTDVGFALLDFRVPVKCEEIDLPAQQHLAARAMQHWSPGTFEQSFPEVASVSVGLDKMPLPDVEKFIKGELQRAGGKVNIFGIGIPLQAISLSGLLLLIGVQTYYWLHLREFESRISQSGTSVPTAWLLLYASRVACAATLVTSVAFPLVAAAILCYAARFWGNWVDRVEYGVPLVCAVLIGLLTLPLTFRVRKLVTKSDGVRDYANVADF